MFLSKHNAKICFFIFTFFSIICFLWILCLMNVNTHRNNITGFGIGICEITDPQGVWEIMFLLARLRNRPNKFSAKRFMWNMIYYLSCINTINLCCAISECLLNVFFLIVKTNEKGHLVQCFACLINTYKPGFFFRSNLRIVTSKSRMNSNISLNTFLFCVNI